MSIKSFDDNKELVSSKSIQVKLIGNKVYYEVRDGYEIELSDKEKLLVYIN